MNKISLVGRLCSDPELSQTGSVPRCRINVACNSRQKDHTDFFACVAWREKANLISQYCKKGDRIYLSGSMGSRTYDKGDGTKPTVWEVNIEDLEFLTTKSERGEEKPKTASQVKMTPLTEVQEEELPF